MLTTKPFGCHAPATERGTRLVSTPVGRAAQPTADFAANWLVKRFRVKPTLAATVAFHAGLGERRHG
jgi:hypothetical protein